MRLFVFGLGYSVRRFIDHHAERFTAISGTVRTAEKQHALRGSRCMPLLFGADHSDPAIAEHIARADLLLVSVPPGASGDPVLAAFDAQIAASGVRRIVYLSTIGVYADHGGNWIDESAAMSGDGRRKQRIDAEAAWLAAPGKRTSVLRLAGIYGPGRNALRNLRAGTARRIVKPDQVFNRIHVEDVARAIDKAFAFDRAGIWNVCDDEPGPPQDVIAYAATLMGMSAPPEQSFDDTEMSPMARSFYATSNRVSNARMKREMGIELAFPNYRDGLTALWQSGEGK
ncbi:SDR family oxidoreductase [Tardiphaga sp.]|uniref:SDR family oxidoreductase n=1 Tax=Tardiphaga sp. TaxID=1926292 RepID=UPI00262AA401|nr:SDR family oxidoreductase [Tardiphaga sp.]MDB5617535.1 NAD(P)-dependent oxidoreductase [Tardiphaga sp.]